METKASLLTVIIVLHYSGVEDTLACLESLAPQLHAELEVVLVDNASSIDPRSEIIARFPALPILRLNENKGWAGGNNAGIDWARKRGADIVCLLNNDTLIPPCAMDRLARAARALGHCLLHPAIDFADITQGAQLDPRHDTTAKEYPGHPGIFQLNFAYGACLVIPIAVIEKIGYFDERFFLQLEEQDYFIRAQRSGIPALCLTAVRITHLESRSFGGRTVPMKTYYMTRNSLLLSAKHDRSWIDRFNSYQKLIWSLYRIANTRRAPRKTTLSWFKFSLWFVSTDVHASSVRKGMVDFMRKKFGAMSRRSNS
jgi:GT2 family glycosyltransferase